MKKLVIIVLILLLSKFVYGQIDSLNTDTLLFKEYFYQNGKVSSYGKMINNKPAGLWISYYISGVKKSEGNWKSGLLDSVWIFYNEVGDTTEKINYYKGNKNGYKYQYFTSSNQKNLIKSKELYLNGKRNGNSYYFYRGGEAYKMIHYHNDYKNGLAYEFDRDSNIISITRYRNNQIVLHEDINRYNKKNEKTGLWKEFYDNGTLKEEKYYNEGKLDGLYKFYNKNGYLINTVYYEKGEIVEKSEEFDIEIDIKEDYDENGNLFFLGSYLNQKPIGVHRYFDKNGEVMKSKAYNVYHQLIAEGIVKLNGNKEGQWTEYYPEGRIKKAEGYYRNNEKIGKWFFYFKNAQIEQTGSYTNGKLSGSWKWYYKNGNLRKEEFYIYGLPDGESIEYCDTGKIIAKGNYIQGQKEGRWIYHVGDQTQTGNYVMGFKNGVWKSYYNNNNSLAFEGNYLQGNPDGKHMNYYPNGQIKEEKYYNEGEKTKSWAKYNNKGQLILVVQYRNNNIYKINGVKIELVNNDQ